MPLLARYYYFEVLRGVLAALADTDYYLNIRVLEHRADRERAFAEVDRRGRPDGVLIVRACPSDEPMARLAQARIPAVMVDAPDPDLRGVGVDHRLTATTMMEHPTLLYWHSSCGFLEMVPEPEQRSATARRLATRKRVLEVGGAP